MTREDAIYWIKNLAVLSTEKDMPQIEEALNMAIEALEQTEPQTDFEKYLDKIRPHDPHKDWFEDKPRMGRPCEKCQEWDCYGCDYKQTERSE